MEMIGKIISETKKLAVEESDSRSELMRYKNELYIEEQTVSLLSKDLENLGNQVTSLEQAVRASDSLKNLAITFRQTFKTSYLLLSFMRKFVEKADPSMEVQVARMNGMQQEYAAILKMYENHPHYQAILQEELNEKELSNLILEKRNQLMKLNTKQEF